MSQRIDYVNPPVGTRYGRLTVLGFGGRYQGRNPKWHCRCECGRETYSQAYKVAKGLTRQCKSCASAAIVVQPIHAERDAAFVEKFAEGRTFSQIATLHKVSRSTVAGAIKRFKDKGGMVGRTLARAGA